MYGYTMPRIALKENNFRQSGSQSYELISYVSVMCRIIHLHINYFKKMYLKSACILISLIPD